MSTLSPEIFWLTQTCLLTGCLWIPYIINRLIEHKPWPALMNPQPDLRPRSMWAERLMRAHANAVENLVVFAPLVLSVQILNLSNFVTVNVCLIYFMARLCHVLLYTLGVPFWRTVAFFIGWLCQICLALRIIGWI